MTLLHPGRVKASHVARTRRFPLGDVLTVATGHMLTPGDMRDVYALVDWMVGYPVTSGEMPAVVDQCRPELLRQHPDLAALVVPDFRDAIERWDWLAALMVRLGRTRDVAPIALPCWQCAGTPEPPYGPPCQRHSRELGALATAQARAGYGRPVHDSKAVA